MLLLHFYTKGEYFYTDTIALFRSFLPIQDLPRVSLNSPVFIITPKIRNFLLALSHEKNMSFFRVFCQLYLARERASSMCQTISSTHTREKKLRDISWSLLSSLYGIIVQHLLMMSLLQINKCNIVCNRKTYLMNMINSRDTCYCTT